MKQKKDKFQPGDVCLVVKDICIPCTQVMVITPKGCGSYLWVTHETKDAPDYNVVGENGVIYVASHEDLQLIYRP